MALSQLQEDLQGYAEGKLYHLIKDTSQAFEIAGRQRDTFACLVALFLKAAAMIVVQGYGTDQREKFLQAAAQVFDEQARDPNPDHERKD